MVAAAAQAVHLQPRRPAAHTALHPPLRLVSPPAPRPSGPGRRDAAYAATLSLLLLAGMLGALLLNTQMQQQARQIAAERTQLAQLSLSAQSLQIADDEAANPIVLARRARALRLRQTASLTVLRVRPVSARTPATERDRAG